MKKRLFALVVVVVLVSFLLLFVPRIDAIILPSATMMIISFITSGFGKDCLSGFKSKKSIVRNINLPP